MGLVRLEEVAHDEPKTEHPYPDVGTGGTQAHEGWNQSVARFKSEVARTVHESRDKLERARIAEAITEAKRETQLEYDRRSALLARPLKE